MFQNLTLSVDAQSAPGADLKVGEDFETFNTLGQAIESMASVINSSPLLGTTPPKGTPPGDEG